ncbi:MAG TPA: metal-dependent hydrolase [Vicinamibacterales bacterium]|jgi:L-ascorbate metabolism protein UlaG (beta-lactamase superfamily)
MAAQKLRITWLGHATFLLRTPGGKTVLTDPWTTDNPACPDSMKKVGPVDLILVSHGHSDHTGDLVSIARSSGAPVVSTYEIGLWLQGKGLQNTAPMAHGGTQQIAGIGVTMVNAIHSSSVMEDGKLVYLGQPAGYVIRFEDGLSAYFAGDTALFGDMRLIGELYKPDMAFLPIGDHFTMGPAEAARAAEMLGVKQVVPMHFGTFPALTGTPARLRELIAKNIQVLELKPGETTE